jgi:uncharacterized membrane protein
MVLNTCVESLPLKTNLLLITYYLLLNQQKVIEMEIKSTRSDTLRDAERLGSLIVGGALVLTGLSQRSLLRTLLTVSGGSLVYHGVMGDKNLENKLMAATGIITNSLRVEKTVTIQNKSPEDLYTFWHNFENLPTFMKNLQSVRIVSETRSHWVAKTPLGNTIEWDAEILIDRPNELITWASASGADVANSGSVRFTPAYPGRGTEVKLVLEYSPPGGAITDAIAKVFNESPEQQIVEDLRHFKMLMETGEIATTEGQSSGRRS